MTSTKCPVKLSEKIVVEREIEVEKCDINSSVNDGQIKDKSKLFSQAETNEKHPLSSVQKVNEPEESIKVSNRFKESYESNKTEQIDGQSLEVFNETECMKFAEKFHKVAWPFEARNIVFV